MKRNLDADAGDPQISKAVKKSKLDGDKTIANQSITTESLQQLLDFSQLSDEQSITARFEVLASALLCDFHLVLRCGDVETKFQILELEFYLRKPGCHEDPFTHGSEEQKVSGRW